MRLRLAQDSPDHRHETDVRVVLQAHDVQFRLRAAAPGGGDALVDDRERARRQ